MNDVDTELRITIDRHGPGPTQHVGRSFFTCHPPNHDPDHDRGYGWRRQLEDRRLSHNNSPPPPPPPSPPPSPPPPPPPPAPNPPEPSPPPPSPPPPAPPPSPQPSPPPPSPSPSPPPSPPRPPSPPMPPPQPPTPPTPPAYPLGTGSLCSNGRMEPPSCTYCQGRYFDSPDYCDSDGDGVGDETGTGACYCACSGHSSSPTAYRDPHAPQSLLDRMAHFCPNWANNNQVPSPPPPSPPPPSPPPPSSPVCEAPMLHAYVTNLAPGLHTATLEYKVAAGTAYFGGAGTIARRLSVQARPPSRPSQAPTP